VRLCAIRDAPLSVDEALAAVADPAAGGVVVFVGAVRDEDEGRRVASLDYAAHPGALAALRAVAERVAADYPACGVAAVHRTGPLAIGELAVVVAVSCPHRGEAFEAARRLIDELKAQVPIWKRQTYVDGDASWVGAP
jgi:molybdopterin synthase catalytic subunit